LKQVLNQLAPTLLVLSGVLGYWAYNQVSAHKEMDEQILAIFQSQCKVSLEEQGYEVTKAEDGSKEETDGAQGEDNTS